MIVNATLSNNRVGVAVILDAASIASNFVDPEVMASFTVIYLFILIILQILETEL